ncbi:MAG: UpxY family transcription antiterminator [Bryobacterales bacterium]|nr:UpxY family transcription antiterminator [Bryobacterales bacterium]
MIAEQEQSPAASNSDPQSYPWFALRVRSHCERIALTHLCERGYQEFSPSYKSERRWTDRTKQIEQFLFPGYVFCRFNPDHRLAILTAPGVVDVVGFGKVPEPIPHAEMDRVRRMVESGLSVTPYPYLSVGQAVLIERGPLSGIEGILVEIKGKVRLVVSIELLQRSVSAEIERCSIRPIRVLSNQLNRDSWPVSP